MGVSKTYCHSKYQVMNVLTSLLFISGKSSSPDNTEKSWNDHIGYNNPRISRESWDKSPEDADFHQRRLMPFYESYSFTHKPDMSNKKIRVVTKFDDNCCIVCIDHFNSACYPLNDNDLCTWEISPTSKPPSIDYEADKEKMMRYGTTVGPNKLMNQAWDYTLKMFQTPLFIRNEDTKKTESPSLFSYYHEDDFT